MKCFMVHNVKFLYNKFACQSRLVNYRVYHSSSIIKRELWFPLQEAIAAPLIKLCDFLHFVCDCKISYQMISLYKNFIAKSHFYNLIDSNLFRWNIFQKIITHINSMHILNAFNQSIKIHFHFYSQQKI